MFKRNLKRRIRKFMKTIETAANKVTKGTNCTIEIGEMMKEKRKARRKWQQSGDPANNTILNNETQKLERQFLFDGVFIRYRYKLFPLEGNKVNRKTYTYTPSIRIDEEAYLEYTENHVSKNMQDWQKWKMKLEQV